MTNPIENSADIIDSRDIIARIEDLESLMGPDMDDDEAHELEALKALAAEAEPYCPDWTYGEALIRDSYFEEYAEQLADDLGIMDPKATWPLNCIDWAAAAEQLKQDYTAVDFDGVTYWVR
jgi:hypothetical protein